MSDTTAIEGKLDEVIRRVTNVETLLTGDPPGSGGMADIVKANRSAVKRLEASPAPATGNAVELAKWKVLTLVATAILSVLSAIGTGAWALGE